MKAHLEREFPGIACTFTEDAGTTGNFEVSVAGRLVHSKTNGDGFVDSPGKFKFLDRAVREATTVTDANGGVAVQGASADIEYAKAAALDSTNDEAGAEDEDEEQSNSSLIVSMLTLVLSIPALIGA